MKAERIAKVIARAGVCSRREAEKIVKEGRVKVDGKKITSPALNVSQKNNIKIDGKPLPQKEPTRLWMFYKPTGTVTTSNDPEKRKTIFDILPKTMPRIVTIGRLDLNSEGLLLLTNNGEAARYIELPQTGWARNYRVRVYGTVDEKKLAYLKNGITINGIKYGSIEATLEKKSESKNSWITFSIKEGKNREIRKICAALGLTVNRLIRVSYGPFQLGSLKPGEIKEAGQKILKKNLGKFI